MSYTIKVSKTVDTSAIDRLQNKIEQLHSGRFTNTSSGLGRLHRKINKIHDETQLDDYPNIQRLQKKVEILHDNLKNIEALTIKKYKIQKTLLEPINIPIIPKIPKMAKMLEIPKIKIAVVEKPEIVVPKLLNKIDFVLASKIALGAGSLGLLISSLL